jgi:hypothetical protein
MILFAADNHYETHAGRVLYDCMANDYEIDFYEDDWSCFETSNLSDRYALIVLNLIAGACKVPPPTPAAEANVRAYLETGKPMLLLHGASAAFWSCDWWRPLVGFRWVRPDDPDGFTRSDHPRIPYTVQVSKSRHPLCRTLQDVSLPEDELYINLEQTCPASVLMETKTEFGTFPMCYEVRSPWGGSIAAYIPGHDADVVRLPGNVANCRALIDYQLNLSNREPS